MTVAGNVVWQSLAATGELKLGEVVGAIRKTLDRALLAIRTSANANGINLAPAGADPVPSPLAKVTLRKHQVKCKKALCHWTMYHPIETTLCCCLRSGCTWRPAASQDVEEVAITAQLDQGTDFTLRAALERWQEE